MNFNFDRYEQAKASLEKNSQHGADLKLHAYEKVWESQLQNEAKIRQKKELRYASNAVKIKQQEQQLVPNIYAFQLSGDRCSCPGHCSFK